MKSRFLEPIFLLLIIFLGFQFLPWQKVNWGKLQLTSAQTVTVTGTAKSQERSQLARFTAGVSVTKDNKEEAVNEVNSKIAALIEAVKNFGIEDKDIQTQSISIYQGEDQYWEEERQKSRPGQWRASNSIEIILREIENTSALTKVLTDSGATNVYGPNFTLDDTEEAEEKLLSEAIDNAREKATIIAQAGKRKLGKIVNVSEGASSSNVYPLLRAEGAGGGGSPVEPGTETVSKTVTVTFELE